MPTSNQVLLDSYIKHQTYLLRLAAGMRNRVLDLVNASRRDIEDIAVSRIGGMAGIETARDWRRVESAANRIETKRKAAWKGAMAQFKTELRELSREEPKFVVQSIQRALPVQLDLKRPSAREIDNLIKRPIEGRTLNQWIGKLATDDVSRVKASVLNAAQNGTPVRQGLRSAFSTTENQVDSVARTLTNSVASRSREETLRQNDEFEQEEFIAVLDSGTTLICASNNGKIFGVGRGPIPPLHFGCRSIRVAVLPAAMLKDMPLTPQTEEELVADYAKENNLGNITSRDDLPYGYKGDFDEWAPQRVSGMIGEPAEVVSYSDWLRNQPVEFQVDTLGPTRAALFREGELDISQFVNRSGDALTLEELKKRSPDAFNKI